MTHFRDVTVFVVGGAVALRTRHDVQLFGLLQRGYRLWPLRLLT